MADNIIDQSIATDVVEKTSAVPPEIAEMMEISLNNGVPPVKEGDNVIVAPEEEKKEPEPPSFELIKEKFNYTNVEDAIKEIEELRGLKANPTIDIKFENEFNEKLFKAIQAGKVKEVNALLTQKEKLESVTGSEINKDTAPEIIKLGMQLKYKDLTQSEIEYKFNKQFGIPKEPIQLINEEDEEFATRHAAWKEQVADIEMNRIIEAKLAKPELEAANTKIALPEIDAPIDDGYLQYKKMLEEQPNIDAEIVETYKAFKPNTVGTKINFNDEANKVAFEFQYEPDAESFKKSVEMVCDITKFWDHFKNQDGTPDRKSFLNAIHFALNKDKILMEAMKQAKNATLKSRLPDNTQGGMKMQTPQVEQQISELDKMMKYSLSGFQKF